MVRTLTLPWALLIAALVCGNLACDRGRLADPKLLCSELRRQQAECRASIDCAALRDPVDRAGCERLMMLASTLEPADDDSACLIPDQEIVARCLRDLDPATGCRCGVR